MNHDLILHSQPHQFECESCDMVFPVMLPISIFEMNEFQKAHWEDVGYKMGA